MQQTSKNAIASPRAMGAEHVAETLQGLERFLAQLAPRYPSKQALVLPALHFVQERLRCVPIAAVEAIALHLGLHPAQVHDTMSFYGFFRTEKDPLGKHRLWVCRSLVCMLRGADAVLQTLCDRLGIAPGETTADGTITLETAECLGACEGAPCILVNDEHRLAVTCEQVATIVEELTRTAG